MDKLSKLVKIFLIVCDEYEKTMQFTVQRFSNNNKPIFSDQEIMTVILYCTAVEHHFQVKEVYNFTSNYLHSWFPLLPSYPTFVKRVNKLTEVFSGLLSTLLSNNTINYSETISLVDSMPIIICSGKRKSKVANEVSDKSYCASKSIYYYGVKAHFLCSRLAGKHPIPSHLIITPASEADLNVFRDNWSGIGKKMVFADKAYQDRLDVNHRIRGVVSCKIYSRCPGKDQTNVKSRRRSVFQSDFFHPTTDRITI